MKYFLKLSSVFFLTLFTIEGCSSIYDVNDGEAVADGRKEEPVSENKPENGRLTVMVSEDLASRLESGTEVLPDGIRLTKAISGDPAFEARHKKAGLHRWYIAEIDENLPVTKAAGSLKGMDGLEYMEIIPETSPDAIPFNDPSAGYQWHLYNDGAFLSGAVRGCDINVTPVWEGFTAGSNTVIVGVVDSGVQHDHPDLDGIVIPAGQSGSKSFLNSEASHPYNYTPQRHGTHVAGVIAAINNNGVGGCGIAGGNDGSGGVRILDCQAIAAIEGDSGDVYSAIVWAADHGAVLLNNSWNLNYDSIDNIPDTTPVLYRTVIDYFINHAGTDSNGNQTGPMKGGVVFFSAGNKEWNKSQPSMYGNVIAVGATGPAGESSTYTNYGDWVDICAPGGNYNPYGNYNAIILSTVSGGGYAQMQGTSQACPMVTGVAALLVSHFGGPGFTNSDLKDLLLGGTDKEKKHSREIGPTLDAMESFVFRDRKMEPVSAMNVSTTKSSATLQWDKGECEDGSYHAYRVFVSDNEAALKGLSPFTTSTAIANRTILTSSVLGSTISATFNQLDSCRNYYATAIGYTRSHHYSPDNGIFCFHINGSPSVKRIGSGPVELTHNGKTNIPVAYSDPDGDELTITVDPGSDACTWTDDGKGNINLHIDASAAAPGYYFIIIKVDDGKITSRFELRYTIFANFPVKKLLPGISDIISSADTPYILDTRNCFSDADGDPIRYAVTCSNPDIQAIVSDGILSIQGSSFAIGEITLSADDGFSEPVSYTFRVRIQDDESGICVSSTVVSDQFLLSCGEPGQAKVSIYSKTGRKVYSDIVYQAPFSPCSINVSGLAPGVYTVIVQFGKGSRKLNIVKI